MATQIRRKARRSQRSAQVAKPSGSVSPRVQKVGPEHFGIMAADCAKARSKWMLADFYGRILVDETEVEHTRQGFEAAVAELRQALATHEIHDLIAAIEQTGHYHRPIQRRLRRRRLRGADRPSPDHPAVPHPRRSQEQDR